MVVLEWPPVRCLRSLRLFKLYIAIPVFLALASSPSASSAAPPSCENMPGEPYYDLYLKPFWMISLRLRWDGFSRVDDAEQLERIFSGNTFEYFEDNCLPHRIHFRSDGYIIHWSSMIGALPLDKEDTWSVENSAVCQSLGGGRVRSCFALFAGDDGRFIVVFDRRVHWARIHKGKDLPSRK